MCVCGGGVKEHKRRNEGMSFSTLLENRIFQREGTIFYLSLYLLIICIKFFINLYNYTYLYVYISINYNFVSYLLIYDIKPM